MDEIPEDPAAGIERETLRCFSLMACAEDCQGLELGDDVLDLAYRAWSQSRLPISADLFSETMGGVRLEEAFYARSGGDPAELALTETCLR